MSNVFDCPGGPLKTVQLKNSTDNLSAEEFLPLIMMGPSRAPVDLLVPISFFYVLLIISGLISNTITCVVILCNASMHTATNCYLFSMAVSDFIFILLGGLVLLVFIFLARNNLLN